MVSVDVSADSAEITLLFRSTLSFFSSLKVPLNCVCVPEYVEKRAIFYDYFLSHTRVKILRKDSEKGASEKREKGKEEEEEGTQTKIVRFNRNHRFFRDIQWTSYRVERKGGGSCFVVSFPRDSHHIL